MYSGLSGFTASQYLMKPSVIFLPSRMVSLESVIWTMRPITPSSRLRVIQSSCPSGPATNPSTVIWTCSLSLRIVAMSECPVWLVSAMRRLTFPEIDKRRDTSAYRFVRGGCRCAARGVHGPIAGALGPQRAQRRGDGSVVADQAELVPRRDGRSDDSTGSSAFHVQAGGLDGARVAWQSRDPFVPSSSGCCAHRTGREGAPNGVTLDHNAVPISCSVAAGVPVFDALAAIFKLAVTTPMPRTSRDDGKLASLVEAN